jgi:hypothetical protein
LLLFGTKLYTGKYLDHKLKKFPFIIFLFLSFLFISCGTTSRFENFVTAKKDKLMEGDKELRFVSFNIPNLHYIEDYFPFRASNPWKLPTEFEIRDALKTIKQLGGKVARIYVLSVRRAGESKKIIRYVEGPGKFNEKAFEALDKVLQIANEEGIRVIIPFVDNWLWWGGKAEYAAFRNKKPDEFWTDLQLIADFKKTINFVLNRKNSCTGVLYKNDKSILGWETGNELNAPLEWHREIADYIKSIDKNHLVIVGLYKLNEEAVQDTSFDVLTTHFYGPVSKAESEIPEIKELTKGKKPYYVGEFGYHNLKDVKAIVDTTINNNLSGIMIWSLRFHARDGGFYQHGENYGVSAYRFPGFSSGERYHEKEIMDYMRKSAYKINGEKEPPLPVPDPPHLLKINDVYDISWQGSAGASSYIIERKSLDSNNWRIIAENISDGNIVFRPLFNDTTAELGNSYFYRIIAKNESGSSAPSNEEGPVEVTYKKLVDEMKDSSEFFKGSDSLSFQSYQNSYKAKEDYDRLRGIKNSFIIYNVPENIDSIKVQVFFMPPADSTNYNQCGLDLSASDSLNNFKILNAKLETYPPLNNFYKFYIPAVYTCSEFPVNSMYLKIRFNTEAQLSRVEIIYSKVEKPDPDIITVK